MLLSFRFCIIGQTRRLLEAGILSVNELASPVVALLLCGVAPSRAAPPQAAALRMLVVLSRHGTAFGFAQEVIDELCGGILARL